MSLTLASTTSNGLNSHSLLKCAVMLKHNSLRVQGQYCRIGGVWLQFTPSVWVFPRTLRRYELVWCYVDEGLSFCWWVMGVSCAEHYLATAAAQPTVRQGTNFQCRKPSNFHQMQNIAFFFIWSFWTRTSTAWPEPPFVMCVCLQLTTDINTSLCLLGCGWGWIKAIYSCIWACENAKFTC